MYLLKTNTVYKPMSSNSKVEMTKKNVACFFFFKAIKQKYHKYIHTGIHVY